MNFNIRLQRFIESLEGRPEFNKDGALRNIVTLLRQIESQNELQEQKGLINHIVIDCVQDLDTINIIADFMSANTK